MKAILRKFLIDVLELVETVDDKETKEYYLKRVGAIAKLFNINMKMS